MKRWFLACALSICAQASLAEPGTAPRADPHPSPWAQYPAEADFDRLLPPETVKAPPPGRAVMRCKAQDDGALSDCALIADSASSAGYGKALLALAGRYRLKPEAVASLPADRMTVVSYGRLPFDKAP